MLLNLIKILGMAENYEDRVVGRFESELVPGFIISTAAVVDTEHPFETAVSHPAYNSGKWIVVEEYDCKKEAALGHEKWVSIMHGPLPDVLVQHSTSSWNVDGQEFPRE